MRKLGLVCMFLTHRRCSTLGPLICLKPTEEMVASDVVFTPRALAVKCSDGGEVQEVLQTMSLNEGERGRGLLSSGDVMPPVVVAVTTKRSRTREVASRYKSATVSSAHAAAITAQRYQSPNRGRSPSPNFGRRSLDRATPSTDRRPASAERRRPWPVAASENKTPTSHNFVDASKRSTSLARKLSIQSLSSSIQSDTSNSSLSNESSVELQNHTGGISSNGQKESSPTGSETGKALDLGLKSLEGKTTPVRKRTPLRRSLQANELTENSKPLVNGQSVKADVRRWHGVGNGKTVIMSKSMDFTFGKEGSASKTTTSILARSASRLDRASPNGRVLSRSANEGPKPKVARRIYMNSTDDISSGDVDEEIGGRQSLLRANSLDANGSDTESSSSESLSIASFAGSVRPRATVVPARFWQDATSLASVRQLKASSSTRSLTPVRATHSGHSTPQYPLSPSSQARPMQALTTSRSLASPTRSRTGHPMLMSQLSLNGRRSNIPSLLNLTFETRKTKQAMGQQEEAHDLRLLHNRWLQWRFVNAQSELAMITQMASAESLLCKCFLRTCDLRMSVATKQGERNKFRQQMKLDSVLAANAAQLEEWETLQSGHASALVGLMEALQATIMRVPLIGGPKIDIQATKEVLASAIDIMNAVDASLNRFLHRAKVADSLLSELATTLISEKASLIECGDLLAAAALLETEERSLRAYFIQQNQCSQEKTESEGELRS